MFSFLSNFFTQKGILLTGLLPLRACRLQNQYLLERCGIADGTVFLFAVPYFTEACTVPKRNLSAYAVSRDYHGYFSALFEELLPILQERYPNERFAGFSDHSPILERDAAAQAGLGVIGKNGLLITKAYSSYVFLGEIITTAKPEQAPTAQAIQGCEGCGLCQQVCPMQEYGSCLSALTQRKGELSAEEQQCLLRHGSVWGCDLCQEVCPHTKRALQSGSIYSPIPYFEEKALPHLTLELLREMNDAEFARRAYAWRGRKTVERNLQLFERSIEKT